MKQIKFVGTYQDILDYMMLGYELSGTLQTVIGKYTSLLFNRKLHICLWEYDECKYMDIAEVLTKNNPPGLIYIP